MNDDDLWNDPPPVAEYRDPELARRFGIDPVPGHRAGFWTDLEASLVDGRTTGDGLAGDADDADRADTAVGEVTTLLPVSAPTDVGPRGGHDRSWGRGRWLAVAAAVLVVAAGGVAIAGRGGPTSPIESATPAPTDESVPPPTSSTSAPTTRPTSTTIVTTTTMPDETTSTVGRVPSSAVDYFDDVEVRGIGPGSAIGFSPDGSAVLIVDDGPGPIVGCSGREHLALYAQDLATGARRAAIHEGVGPGDPRSGELGLDVAIAPFDEPPAGVTTRAVYWTEWCADGSQTFKRGVLAADGMVSMIEPLTPDEANPFLSDPDGVHTSPDGRHRLVVPADGGARVVELDRNGESTAVSYAVPDDLADVVVRDAAWAPSGDVVALGTDDAVVMWSPFTGERQRFASGATADLAFDPSGRRLAVASSDETARSSVLTFGDLPVPVPAPARCSGRVELEAMTIDGLVANGLPPAVAATAMAVDQAAAACEWDALDALTAEGFVASFGGDPAVTLWRQQEERGQSPMWYLRVLLRQPPAVDQSGDTVLHTWPSLHLDTTCIYGRAERRVLSALGYDPDEAEQACEVTGGYGYYRTAIAADGTWRFLVDGD